MKDILQETHDSEQKILLNEAESLAEMGSWKWSEANNELIWSAGLYNILHKNPNEHVSWDSFMENVYYEDQLAVATFLNEVKTNRIGSSIDYRTLWKKSLRFYSLTVKPHTLYNIDILGTVVDITVRKETEHQLLQQFQNQVDIIGELDKNEKKYRTLFERSIDPIFLASEELVLMDVNNAFLNLFAITAMPERSCTVRDIFLNEVDYHHFEATLKSQGQVRDFEVILITKDKQEKSCIINCAFIPDQETEICRYQGIIHDLTVRKQAECDMLVAERLSLTGKIARTLAHEVRNPLTNLNLALDQLRDEIPPGNESAKLYGDIIERNANRIEQLMGEMLNSSKPKQLHLELAAINEIIENTLSLAEDRIKLENISLLTNYQKDLPKIMVDKAEIQMALLNIIINAIEAMIPGKGILKIDAATKDTVLTITIADNGKGIPASDLAKLFDPFFTGKTSGMGLGLTSTKNILNSHSAQVDVKSELNKGTIFSINFKLA
ncbi:MAG: PAS domain S-box protein [Cyclobacteriaceae bacterium]|nr:PAS domain S-box protein [Cyclobacteriaceae bacterium]